MKPPSAARLVEALGPARTAAVLQVLGAGGTARLLAAMGTRQAAAAALTAVASASFTAAVLARISERAAAGEILSLLTPALAAETLTAPPRDLRGGDKNDPLWAGFLGTEAGVYTRPLFGSTQANKGHLHPI